MNDKIKVNIKKSYNGVGIVTNQNLLNYLISNPDTYFDITISSPSYDYETERYMFKKTYISGTFSEIHNVDVDIYKLDHPYLGTFTGPIIHSATVLLDEEIALYLKMKGII